MRNDHIDILVLGVYLGEVMNGHVTYRRSRQAEKDQVYCQNGSKGQHKLRQLVRTTLEPALQEVGGASADLLSSARLSACST